MTFRSLQMERHQLILPRQCAYMAMDILGRQNKIHIIPNKNIADRPYHQMVKRCEESLQKIEVLQNQMKQINIQFEEYDQLQSSFYERCNQIWKEQAMKLGVDETKLFDVYENQINQQYQEFQSLMRRLDKMKQEKEEALQTIACLETIAEFFSDGSKKRQSIDYYVNNIAYSNAMNGVSYVVAVIEPQSQLRLSKMIYRVSRGFACTRTLSSFKYSGLRAFEQKVMLVIYPTSESTVLERKLKKVVESFSQRYFIMNQIQSDSMPDLEKYKQQDLQIQNLWEMTSKQFLAFMNKIKDIAYIQKWRIYLWKQKVLYESLGEFQSKEQFYFGEIFVPTLEVNDFKRKLQSIVPAPTMYRLPLVNPPTAFDSNSYTAISQQIVDTYGVPRYQQMNPSIFTTVTFPFFFGVMFGDIGHGGLLFFLGIYLIFNNDRIQKSSMKFVCQLRYMIAMMGFFAFYCGFIYNDLIGFNVNLFSSCYNPPLHPDHSQETDVVPMPQFPKPNCVYPFGLDPIWGRAQNELNYTNSLKMKLSVIIAIVHMTFGIFLKASNARFFRKSLDYFFEFWPQVIFMVLLFGYMDFLIIFKWLQPWDVKYDSITPPQQWAPSIITTMMNIGLKMGQTTDKPDGTGNMWGNKGDSWQDTLQLCILIVAFLCVPIMLLPKPIIQIQEHKKKRMMEPLMNTEQEIPEDNELRQKLTSGAEQEHESEVDDQHSASQIFVHQLIETIQFVLGAVSNTASYLRLWALSLAHGQLAKVFYDYTVGVMIGVEYVEIGSMIAGFWLLSWITFGIIICMDSMQCFLHSLRLHWVEFQNKFFKGDGYRYTPLSFEKVILFKKSKNDL